jgi:hypothetical protein
MKISVRVSKYVSPMEDCYASRYDAIFFSSDGSRYITQKVYEGKVFDKKGLIGQAKKVIADGYTKNEKLPKLDSSDEYMEISV